MIDEHEHIICAATAKGTMHNFKLFKESRLPIKPETCVYVDLEYLGITKEHNNCKIPYKNLKELAKYAKTHKIKLADWGLGAVPTLIALKAAQIGGFKFEGTAYRNLNPLLVVSGDADVITLSTPSLKDYIESGKIRLLAVMLPKRLRNYPDVPTVSQQGFGKAYSIWFGLFVPKRTPENRARRLREVFFNVMAMPKIQKIIRRVGVVYDPTSPKEARRQMDNELDSFGAIMKKLGIIK